MFLYAVLVLLALAGLWDLVLGLWLLCLGALGLLLRPVAAGLRILSARYPWL